jgi:hypothetical protein
MAEESFLSRPKPTKGCSVNNNSSSNNNNSLLRKSLTSPEGALHKLRIIRLDVLVIN